MRRLGIGIAVAVSALCAPAIAAYPERPITLVVPYAPGGAADATARIVAARLGPKLGTTVIVENRPGATGTIGESYVSKAQPDGHVLVYVATPYSINPYIYPQMPYAQDALLPLTLVTLAANALVVKADSPYKTTADLVAKIKEQPGKLSYASGGSGTVQRLAAEMFRQHLQLDAVHVPYKSGGPAITDVAGGQVDFMFATLAGTSGLIKGGRLRALAVTSAQRSPLFPDLPTVAESSIPSYQAVEWNGILAPAKIPKVIAEKLSSAIVEVLREPDVQQRLKEMGLQPVGSTPVEFTAFIKAENEKWEKVIKAGGIKAD
ncbi:Bug family tripartite tricarboxylate transporter substrate binding protein [Acidovorax sp. sif0715]|uniref:Bug family tripartite tricarboxylate transporter substrate binding protein n=1 Tax=unclassified Acidovorax TaxID=2684926 RepID=UPI00351DA851